MQSVHVGSTIQKMQIYCESIRLNNISFHSKQLHCDLIGSRTRRRWTRRREIFAGFRRLYRKLIRSTVDRHRKRKIRHF